jgi:DNA-binding MarR family transcriptional regulator
MNKFNPMEKQILTTLYRSRKALPTKTVADRTGISWVTAKKHLTILYEKGVLERARYSNAVYWWIRVD